MRFPAPAFVFSLVLAGTMVAGGAANADPKGTWLTGTGDAKVRLSDCGPNLCGTIVWLEEPRADTGNPDPAKRERPLVGVQMLSGMAPSGTDEWSGKLYNPRDGKTYTGKIKLNGATLKLSGCVLGGLICKSETWTRAN